MGSIMADQNFANHRRNVPLFHFVVLPLLLLTLIGSIVNLIQSLGDHERLYSAALIVALSVAGFLTAFFGRVFALKAQDRAIRAEENLRHFVMAGKLMDPRLSTLQIVALRFASNGEFVALAQKAAQDGMQPADIKRNVKNWRADEYRA
jgi:L-cystine uptake protein TcyP (sodium:dicarboxylate symporter family)